MKKHFLEEYAVQQQHLIQQQRLSVQKQAYTLRHAARLDRFFFKENSRNQDSEGFQLSTKTKIGAKVRSKYGLPSIYVIIIPYTT